LEKKLSGSLPVSAAGVVVLIAAAWACGVCAAALGVWSGVYGWRMGVVIVAGVWERWGLKLLVEALVVKR
jgi:hypothetical protein